MLGLTCPGEPRIEIANFSKREKYEHFLTDIKSHKVSVLPFEVGSQTGD